MAAYLAAHRVDEEIVEQFSSRLQVALSVVTPATAHQASIPEGHLVILTSDGVHDQVTYDEVEAFVGNHQADAQALADALVAGAQPGEAGYRDDVMAIILVPAQPIPAVVSGTPSRPGQVSSRGSPL
ncbi:PP2C family serine/threonine-protein phosphatase [Streptomyces sp. NPDC005078]|uniref:PP2C family serine/threonine-protein phosphatase n=1 Tax=unclassified Streptomyces TaxID=2593676 RepID=UPI0033BC0C3C